MENLFNFATKELSQDAFLCWLFANYNCEQKEVRDFSRHLLAWFITDNLSQDNIKNITNVKIKTQFKNIDIVIECKYENDNYIIVIEDKISSNAHDQQLVRYKNTISNFYNDTYQKRFIFYKTDIIGKEEISYLNTFNGWKIKQITEIYEAFRSFLAFNKAVDFDNEIIHYYYENLATVFNAITNRPSKVSEWGLRSWHSFFEDYVPPCGIEQGAEIRSYQKQYYYFKFSIDGHAEDLPSIEVRSRDYNNGILKFRVVVYNVLQSNITENSMTEWKNVLIANEIKICNRTDIFKNKQIGVFERAITNNNELSLREVFNKVGNLLINLYSKKSFEE